MNRKKIATVPPEQVRPQDREPKSNEKSLNLADRSATLERLVEEDLAYDNACLLDEGRAGRQNWILHPLKVQCQKVAPFDPILTRPRRQRPLVNYSLGVKANVRELREMVLWNQEGARGSPVWARADMQRDLAVDFAECEIPSGDIVVVSRAMRQLEEG